MQTLDSENVEVIASASSPYQLQPKTRLKAVVYARLVEVRKLCSITLNHFWHLLGRLSFSQCPRVFTTGQGLLALVEHDLYSCKSQPRSWWWKADARRFAARLACRLDAKSSRFLDSLIANLRARTKLHSHRFVLSRCPIGTLRES